MSVKNSPAECKNADFHFKNYCIFFYMQFEKNRNASCEGCGAGWKYIPQKNTCIKAIDTAPAKTDIDEFPQVLPPAQSLLLVQKTPNEMTKQC